MLKDNSIWLGTSPEGAVTMLPQLANRHGLVSGATGTGKTVTLQVMAEAFSQLGVPVFLSDVKGDLAGLAKPGEMNDKIVSRLAQCGVTDYTNQAFPVTFWDVFGKSGHPVRATVSEMGPLLLARMLQLNDTQSGVLHLVFRIADDEGMLLIDLKDLRAMLVFVGENAANYTLRYGNITKSSVGAIQRAIAVLEDQGGNQFFGEPSLDINNWFLRDEEGRGMINILAADKLFLRPAMYSAFMLWMLGEIYELLPERGDSQQPQMVFFFDEAHLLFEDCPRELLDRVELTIRLIRSKGVGVFFVTQNPSDVPSSVLSQLAARVQHALRAFTPQEQRVIKSVADTFRPNPAFDTEQAIMSLGTGEAMISFLSKDGSPTIVQRAVVLPPQSSIGSISDSLRATILETSDLAGKYDTTFDRQSAYEVLSGKYATHGVQQTSVVTAQDADDSGEPVAPARATFKVYNPQTGIYETREMEMPAPAVPTPAPVPQQEVLAPSAPTQTPAVQERPPVLVYNPRTGQYEPQDITEYRAPKTAAAKKQADPKKEKGFAEKMLDNFTRSTASGAGYQVGRAITRNILGVFGLK